MSVEIQEQQEFSSHNDSDEVKSKLKSDSGFKRVYIKIKEIFKKKEEV